MKELLDVTHYPDSIYAYGGAAGPKVGKVIDGVNYLVKLPGNLRERELKNISLSYSNSPVSEYMGSHIYQGVGIPVHDTLLAKFNGKIVVLCRDFKERGDELIEFSRLKTTFAPPIMHEDGEYTLGKGTDIDEILRVLRVHHMTRNMPEIQDRFWETFIVDALIGNPDRNNGNWGIIRDLNDQFRIAPVYDNGNCLNDKWSDTKIVQALNDEIILKNEAYRAKTNIFTRKGHKVNPYKLILSHEYPECDEALRRIVPRVNMEQITQILTELTDANLISEIKQTFLTALLKMRYEEVLIPAYKQTN